VANLDDRLREELRRSLRPADPVELYEDLSKRRGRRRVARKIGAGALVVAVLAVAAGGFLFFNDIFRGAPADGGESGERISFSTYPLPFPSPTGPTDFAGFGVYTLDPSSGDATLVSGEPQAFTPSWSPDGSVLAYAIDGPGSPQDLLGQVWVVNADGSDPRLLLDVGGSVDSMAWSPDGRSMVIARERAQIEGQGPVYDVVIADVASGKIGAPLPIADGVVEVDWSPDGSRLVIARDGQGLSVVDIDGGNERSIVDDGSSPAWSPDGRAIAYLARATDGSKVSQVFTVDPDGGTPKQLTTGLAYANGPSWAPDGSAILFGSMQAEYDQFGLLKEPATCLLETVRVDGTGRAVLSDAVPEDMCVRATAWA